MAQAVESKKSVAKIERPRTRTLVPETCPEFSIFAILIRDSIRQAKADIRHGASCPTISMAPVLAITSLVAGTWR